MEQLELEYQLSLYESVVQLNCSQKSEVLLVQKSSNGKVYIKKILKSFNREVFEKLREIRTIHMPRIYDIFEYDETLIIIEEFINGQTLEELLNEQGTLPENVAIRYMMTLCEALAQMHEQQPPLIHRDLKPSNVMISNDGVLKLIDFDVSRIYRHDRELDTHVLGTKGYASPEQFGFEQTDARSDIYSIGVMLNVLITGSSPKEQPLQSALRPVVEKCTCFSPEDRYQNVNELKEALGELIKEPKPTVEKVEVSQVHLKKNIFLRILDELHQIPGYRGRVWSFKIIATLWYAFLLFGAFHAISLSNIAMASMLLMMTLLNGNYKNIWSRNRLLRDNKMVGLMFYNFIIFIGFGMFL